MPSARYAFILAYVLCLTSTYGKNSLSAAGQQEFLPVSLQRVGHRWWKF